MDDTLRVQWSERASSRNCHIAVTTRLLVGSSHVKQGMTENPPSSAGRPRDPSGSGAFRMSRPILAAPLTVCVCKDGGNLPGIPTTSRLAGRAGDGGSTQVPQGDQPHPSGRYRVKVYADNWSSVSARSPP